MGKKEDIYRQFHRHLSNFNLFIDAIVAVVHAEFVVQLIPHATHRPCEIQFVRIKIRGFGDIARFDHDDFDVETFHLQSKNRRIRFNGTFCYGERTVKRSRSPVGNGWNVNDPSLALSDKRQKCVRHSNNSEQIDRHDLKWPKRENQKFLTFHIHLNVVIYLLVGFVRCPF